MAITDRNSEASPGADGAGAKREAADRVDQLRDDLLEVSHDIHAHPELAYNEVRAAALLCSRLKDAGFVVSEGICGIETAFSAQLGESGPNLAICAEYDALPKIGHACGHNVIAAAALGAGFALARLTEKLGFRLTIMGTPAEEAGGGKETLIERGAFDDIDAAMMIHPAPVDITEPPMLAVASIKIRFAGKESHASAFPEQGINALDAMHISYTAVACMRQHIAPTDRIHGIITKGGEASNIVPALTVASYSVRSRTTAELEKLIDRVRNCFEAGALATGCTLTFEVLGNLYKEMRHNMTMANAYRANAENLGRTVLARELVDPKYAGSTDMGNVSYKVPAIHPMIGINSFPAVNHQPEFTEHCASEAADRAVVDGAKAMAWTVIDLVSEPDLLERTRAEFSTGRH